MEENEKDININHLRRKKNWFEEKVERRGEEKKVKKNLKKKREKT